MAKLRGRGIAAVNYPTGMNLGGDPTQALATTQELLPILERTTLYTWRRHLAAEVERALFPDGSAVENLVESRPAVVGFIDMTGYTRLSRNVDLDELAMVLDRFESTVLDTVVAHGGRVIKNLGDEILFVIDDPVSAADWIANTSVKSRV